MFESITKRRKNPVVNFFGWAMLTVVCVIFIFIGFSPDNSFLGGGGAAAQVNGDAISLRDFKELVDRLDSGSSSGDRNARRKTQENAMNILVTRSLIAQEASDLNIHVSDSEVGQTILDLKFLYDDGIFSRVNYKSYLRQIAMTESQFEEKVRQDLAIRKMSRILGYAASDLDLIDDFDTKVDQAKMNVSYLTLSADQIKQDLNPEKMKAFQEEKKSDIKGYYDKNLAEFTQKPQVKARHILVKSKDDKPESFQAALDKMKEILKTTTVENFSEMAKKHSEDPGSKAKGGDLGFFPKGRMVPEFENSAFSQEPGKIGAPVKTQYGYHVILVDEKKEAKTSSLEEVQDQIARKLYKTKRFEDLTTQVKDRLKEGQFDELESLAKSNGWVWKDTGFFSITKENIPGVGNNGEFLNKALELTKEKPYSSDLVRAGNRAFVLKFKQAKLDTQAPPNNQMDFFKKIMAQQKENQLIQNWTDSLRKKASIKINSDVIR